MRISAHEIERPVLDALADLLANPDKLIDAADLDGCSSRDIDTAIKSARAMRNELAVATPARRREIIATLIQRVTLAEDAIGIEIGKVYLCEMLGASSVSDRDAVHTIRIPVLLRRRGVELRLVIDSSAYGRSPRQDPALIKAIVRAHDWKGRLLRRDAEGTTSIAREEGVANSYVTRVVRLAFLAPDITQAILDGRQPAHLSAECLINDRAIPLAWSDQRAALGFADG